MKNLVLAILCVSITAIVLLVCGLMATLHENEMLIGKFKATCTTSGGTTMRDFNGFLVCAKPIN